MNSKRASGILLHPTSLPGPFGIGDLGREAHNFLDFLSKSGQKYWQVLPLNPTGYGNSPYASFSAFAGNPLLISPEILIEEGLLQESDLDHTPEFSASQVDYQQVEQWKHGLLEKSYLNFKTLASQDDRKKFQEFCNSHDFWLADYSCFQAFKTYYGRDTEVKSWLDWEKEGRDPHKQKHLEEKLKDEIFFQKYLQYEFLKQWMFLKKSANEKNILLIGDAPIFVAFDSADVWANRELFQIDELGSPLSVAGVPPDYFSDTGQLWGNPLYDWQEMKKRGYQWWVQRMSVMFQLVDVVRLDHFRGFDAYWAIPFGAETAEEGRWQKGPGADFFKTLKDHFDHLPLIAEDLGVITPRVEKLRDRFQFPGMKILQFAFNTDGTNDYLPHNFSQNSVVYPGTHDNDTTVGWFEKATEKEREHVMEYAGSDGKNVHWDLIRLGLGSVANTAIFSLQDVLGLDSTARMNTPSVEDGNWSWRFESSVVTDEIQDELKRLALLYGR